MVRTLLVLLVCAVVAPSVAAGGRIVLGSRAYNCFPGAGATLVEGLLVFDRQWSRLAIVAVVIANGKETAWTYMLPRSVFYTGLYDAVVRFEDRDMTVYKIGEAVPKGKDATVVPIRMRESVRIDLRGLECTLSFDPDVCRQPMPSSVARERVDRFGELHGLE